MINFWNAHAPDIVSLLNRALKKFPISTVIVHSSSCDMFFKIARRIRIFKGRGEKVKFVYEIYCSVVEAILKYYFRERELNVVF